MFASEVRVCVWRVRWSGGSVLTYLCVVALRGPSVHSWTRPRPPCCLCPAANGGVGWRARRHGFRRTLGRRKPLDDKRRLAHSRSTRDLMSYPICAGRRSCGSDASRAPQRTLRRAAPAPVNFTVWRGSGMRTTAPGVGHRGSRVQTCMPHGSKNTGAAVASPGREGVRAHVRAPDFAVVQLARGALACSAQAPVLERHGRNHTGRLDAAPPTCAIPSRCSPGT